MSVGIIIALALGVLVGSVVVQIALVRWSAGRLADRLGAAWAAVAEAHGLHPGERTLGVALRYAGAIDGHPVHLVAWRRWFSKLAVGWRSWRVVVIEVDARWRCGPESRDGLVWTADQGSLGYQGGRTLGWTGEALEKDAPIVAPGVAASAPRADLSPEDLDLLTRRVATGQAWILPDRVSLAWTEAAEDEQAALEAAIADARALARLAAGARG